MEVYPSTLSMRIYALNLQNTAFREPEKTLIKEQSLQGQNQKEKCGSCT